MSEQEFKTPLDLLKEEATAKGISFHPSIGLEKLQEKIEEFEEAEEAKALAAAAESAPKPAPEEVPVEAPVAAKPIKETETAKRKRLKNEAMRMRRVRVVCMDPAKKDWEGEIFSVGNKVIGTYRKMIPFNVEWHIPQILYNVIKAKKCQVFRTIKVKTAIGMVDKRESVLINAFAIEDLPDLTEQELKALAQRQAMARGTSAE